MRERNCIFRKILHSNRQTRQLKDRHEVATRSASLTSSVDSSAILRFSPARTGTGVNVCASKSDLPFSGVIFKPFEEVKKELDLVPTLPQLSLARRKYDDACEAAVNEQINVAYNVSYVYHPMFAYFDRNKVALRGLAKFFKESSEEEREHAEHLMQYQNKRGGKVNLQAIVMPLSSLIMQRRKMLYTVAENSHDVQPRMMIHRCDAATA